LEVFSMRPDETSDVYLNVAAAVQSLLHGLKLLVAKTESEIKTQRRSASTDELGRAYFSDMLELIFDRCAENLGTLFSIVQPTGFRRELRDDTLRVIRRLAPMILFESDLCRTCLMDDFSARLAEFLAAVERNAVCPQVAAAKVA
jgi:hypothetical protein